MLYQLSYTRVSAGQRGRRAAGQFMRARLCISSDTHSAILPRRPAALLPRFHGGGRIRTYVGR
jgi:hypothetical protein